MLLIPLYATDTYENECNTIQNFKYLIRIDKVSIMEVFFCSSTWKSCEFCQEQSEFNQYAIPELLIIGNTLLFMGEKNNFNHL